MSFNIIGFLEQFMSHNFFIKLTQFEKTGSMRKDYKNLITLFKIFTFLLFDSGVCSPFNKGNEMNFKKKHVNLQK